MRCRFILALVLSLCVTFLPGPLPAQTRHDTLEALRAMQSACKSEITYDRYVSALDDLQSQLKGFFDSKESENNLEFSIAVERALVAYQSTFAVWRSTVEYGQESVNSDHPTIRKMLYTYPEAKSLFSQDGHADIRKLIVFFMDKADSRISEAKRLMGKR